MCSGTHIKTKINTFVKWFFMDKTVFWTILPGLVGHLKAFGNMQYECQQADVLKEELEPHYSYSVYTLFYFLGRECDRRKLKLKN